MFPWVYMDVKPDFHPAGITWIKDVGKQSDKRIIGRRKLGSDEV